MKQYINKKSLCILILSAIFLFSVFPVAAVDIAVGIQANEENFAAEKMSVYPGFNVRFVGGSGYYGGTLTFDFVSADVSRDVYGLEQDDNARLASLFLVGQLPLRQFSFYAGPGIGSYIDKYSKIHFTIEDLKMLYMKVGASFRFSSIQFFAEDIMYMYVAPVFGLSINKPRVVIGASYVF